MVPGNVDAAAGPESPIMVLVEVGLLLGDKDSALEIARVSESDGIFDAMWDPGAAKVD